MIRYFSTLLLISVIFLSGCSTSIKIDKSYTPLKNRTLEYEVYPSKKLIAKSIVSKKVLDIFRTRLSYQLNKEGRLSKKNKEAEEKVEIIITKYRMRHGASRAMLGILAGTDSMISTIIVKEKKSNKTVAEFTVQSGNITAWGTSSRMIKDHADQIARYLTGTQKSP